MKLSLVALVAGALAIGTAWVVEDYLTTDCMIQEVVIRELPNGRITYTELTAGKCYLIE